MNKLNVVTIRKQFLEWKHYVQAKRELDLVAYRIPNKPNGEYTTLVRPRLKSGERIYGIPHDIN